jgi:hypothetical protein
MKKLTIVLCVMWAVGACADVDVDDINMAVNQSVAAARALDGGEGDAGDDGGVVDTEIEDTATVDTETVDTETEEEVTYFWYLRCNSTSFGLDADSLMVDGDEPNIKTLTLEVIEPWMTTAGETCSVFRTEEEGEWWPLTPFGSDVSPVVVPGGGTLVVSWQPFRVTYPALGNYEFRLDIEDNTFTITALNPGGPTCSDGEQNGDETDVDCGGPLCGGCESGKNCIGNSDCLSNFCNDGICEVQQTECTAETAVDLGGTGNWVTVPSNGCVKVESGYPDWWREDHPMNLMNPEGSGYPIPFTWANSCANGSGGGTFAQSWESKRLEPTSAECATVIDLLGDGTSDITLQYYGF